MNRLNSLLVASLLLPLAACKQDAPPGETSVRALRLVYQNNLDGETEPCG